MKKWIITLCTISLAIAGSSQPYYKDVAPIFYKNCTNCHNQYGHFSLVGYSQAFSYSKQILTNLTSGTMPPWPPDSSYVHFMHERFISVIEKNAILKWIADGSQPGDTTLGPAPPTYTRYQLSGTPDLILKIPPFVSNAGSIDAYDCFSLPTGLTTDRCIMAYEIVAGNPSIVHHVLATIDTTGTATSDTSGACYTPPNSDLRIGQYAPGAEPTIFPNTSPLKIGIRLKAGSNIILQVHYAPGTIGQTDSTQIRLFFYPITATGIREVHVTGFLKNGTMLIPADSVKTYTVHYPKIGIIPAPMSLFAVFPHSHKIDTSITIYSTAPSGTITPLLRINNWNFDWQGYYTYHRLVKILAGSTITGIHVFNNTSRNPNNPDNPPDAVKNGPGTEDEMIADIFEWLSYQPGDENINLDSLMNLGQALAIQPVTLEEQQHVSVFPNPSDGTFTITTAKGSLGLVTIYNFLGQVVYDKKINAGKEIVNLEDVPSGIYIVCAQGQHLRIVKQ